MEVPIIRVNILKLLITKNWGTPGPLSGGYEAPGETPAKLEKLYVCVSKYLKFAMPWCANGSIHMTVRKEPGATIKV